MRRKKSHRSVYIRVSAEWTVTGRPQEDSSGRIFLIPLVLFSWINVGLAKKRLRVRHKAMARGKVKGRILGEKTANNSHFL